MEIAGTNNTVDFERTNLNPFLSPIIIGKIKYYTPVTKRIFNGQMNFTGLDKNIISGSTAVSSDIYGTAIKVCHILDSKA